MEETLDNVIDKLKKIRKKELKESSPLDDFFEAEEKPENENNNGTTSTEGGLDITPLGKSAKTEAYVEAKETVAESYEGRKNLDKDLAKGIRELSFDELDSSPENRGMESEREKENIVIEIQSKEPAKVKQIKLIIALLDADQFEAAHQEIDNLISL